MRLSELLTCPVLDADGVRVGRVHDVRLLDDGPSLANGQPGFRVEGLVVGGSGLGVRLGYERHGLTGPWLLRWLFRRVEHRNLWVDVDQVGAWPGEHLRLRVPRSELTALSVALDGR